MKKASFVVSSHYNDNKIFDLSNKTLNRDNCLYPFHLLKQALLIKGYDLSTQDINRIDDSSLVIYNEMPQVLPQDIQKSYVILFESEIIRPDNWLLENHNYFNKVFTWNDDFVDNKKYIKINFPNTKPNTEFRLFEQKENFCCVISGNKSAAHPKELYSKRKDILNWYEANCPERLDLYGMGWDKPDASQSIFFKILRKFNLLKYIPYSAPKSYKGLVDFKIETLKNYKFSFCFENGRDITGYITEKIMDCLFAGCVPIYWGAQNIADHIPKDCYISYNDFSSIDELHKFLESMKSGEYNKYQQAILNFLESESYYPFSDEYFVNQIVGSI